MADLFTLDSSHNFGIYTKSGKRSIFQIDFQDKKISVIERGKIGKAYDFHNVENYDSEDSLHIVIRFRGNKTFEFDADTAEEKYTICRLLGMILAPDPADSDIIRREKGSNGSLSTTKQVIKEGHVDKKGNTKIPTWSKRRLQVCPGEFSYYKPGYEVALNLVQLWENSTTISIHGNNGLCVSVRDRTYYFRVNSEKGVNIEEERDAWIKAFNQAKQRKRATYLLLEMSNQKQPSKLDPLTPVDDAFEDVIYRNDQKSPASTSSSNSSREVLEGLEAIHRLDEVLDNDEFGSNARSRQTIALSVVEKTNPLSAPTKNRARPPALQLRNESLQTPEDSTYDFIPEPDYSPPPSPPAPLVPSPLDSTSPITRDNQTSGKYKMRISTNNQQENGDPRESGLYTRVIKTDSVKSPGVKTGENFNKSRPAPGAVNVLPNNGEFPKLKRVESKDNSFESDKQSPRAVYSNQVTAQPDYDNVSIMGVRKNSTDQTYANDLRKTDTPEKASSPREKTKQAPPIPTPGRPAPPVPCPPPAAPAPPPPQQMQSRPLGKGHLKQVHWTRTPKPMIAQSIWERPMNLSNKLNLARLEEQFALKDRDVPTTPGPKTPTSGKPQLLVDAKRAQILDIFMSGLKNDGTRKLVNVLNSVSEDENFPAEKLTTIRRYQPNEEEIDMYRAHAHRKHELHPVDQFMLELCEIPCLSIRIDICLILWEFPWQYDSTCQLVEQVHAACDELLTSEMLVAVLQYILAIGNHLNRNWSESNVTPGFQVTSLDKVLGVRGKESGYTLAHFLVEQLEHTDPVLLRWPDTVATVKKCEQVSVKSVAAESEVLKGDLAKVKRHLKTLRSQSAFQNRQDNKFQQDAQNLTVEYEMKLEKLDRRSGELQNKYRKILTRFGEPLYQRSDQMFAIIADFMDKFRAAIKDLDNKCLEKKKST
ncbi:delphilin-like [Dreissena polymorpha]|nr:delphilin-like [Dreissena polymorpha]XP_052230013.1 delphilin-like [Dreissena polymorpha]